MRAHIHRRQFLIGPRPVEILSDWRSLPLRGAGYLSHCSEFRVTRSTDAEGNEWCILGIAVQTDDNRPDPAQEISTAVPDSIQDRYHHWAGRWVLVGNGKLHMDASGLLSCFYGRPRGSDQEGGLWVSSSPAILAEVIGASTELSYPIEHGLGFDWYVPPRTGLQSVRRLLPSQVLDLPSGKVGSRRLLAPMPPSLVYEEVLDQLQYYLITGLRNISRISNRLCLPLTAGHDSRTLLAAAKHANISVKVYTHDHSGLTHADRILPPRLTAAVGLDHTFYTGSGHNSDLAEMYNRHTAGHSVDRDRFYFSHNYFRWCRTGDMILRGGCFEIGRAFRKRFPMERYGDSLPNAGEIIANYRERGFSYAGRDPSEFFPDPLREAIEDWIAWSESTPQPGMDWRDRYFVDQRLVGWLGSIEQSLDLINADRFYIANSHRFYALVLQIPEEIRLRDGAGHQHELIRRMAPELMRFPFNPPDPVPLHKLILDKLKHAKSKLSNRRV